MSPTRIRPRLPQRPPPLAGSMGIGARWVSLLTRVAYRSPSCVSILCAQRQRRQSPNRRGTGWDRTLADPEVGWDSAPA